MTANPDDEPVREPAEQGQRPPEEIREDIEQTRAELGDTVEALAQKTDVKGQARGRVDEVKRNIARRRAQLAARARATTPDSARRGGQQIMSKVRQNPAPVTLGGAVLAAFLLGRATARR